MTQRIFETLFIGYTILLTKLSKFHECTVFQKKKKPYTYQEEKLCAEITNDPNICSSQII